VEKRGDRSTRESASQAALWQEDALLGSKGLAEVTRSDNSDQSNLGVNEPASHSTYFCKHPNSADAGLPKEQPACDRSRPTRSKFG
jgi:hypothetical protein